MNSIVEIKKSLRKINETMHYIEIKDENFTTNLKWLLLKCKQDSFYAELIKSEKGKFINEKNRPN